MKHMGLWAWFFFEMAWWCFWFTQDTKGFSLHETLFLYKNVWFLMNSLWIIRFVFLCWKRLCVHKHAKSMLKIAQDDVCVFTTAWIFFFYCIGLWTMFSGSLFIYWTYSDKHKLILIAKTLIWIYFPTQYLPPIKHHVQRWVLCFWWTLVNESLDHFRMLYYSFTECLFTSINSPSCFPAKNNFYFVTKLTSFLHLCINLMNAILNKSWENLSKKTFTLYNKRK